MVILSRDYNLFRVVSFRDKTDENGGINKLKRD